MFMEIVKLLFHYVPEAWRIIRVIHNIHTNGQVDVLRLNLNRFIQLKQWKNLSIGL